MDRPAAVNHQHVTHDHVRQVARQEQHRADQIVRLIPSSDGQHLGGRPFLVPGRSRITLRVSVSVMHGATTLTMTPWLAHSSDSARDR